MEVDRTSWFGTLTENISQMEVDSFDWFGALTAAGLDSNGGKLIPDVLRIIAQFCTSKVVSFEIDFQRKICCTYAYAFQVDPHTSLVESFKRYFKNPGERDWNLIEYFKTPLVIYNNIWPIDFDILGRFLCLPHTNASEFNTLITTIRVCARESNRPDVSVLNIKDLYYYQVGPDGTMIKRKSPAHIDECRAGSARAPDATPCLWWVA